MNFIFLNTTRWEESHRTHLSNQLALQLAKRNHRVLALQPLSGASDLKRDSNVQIASLPDLGLEPRAVEHAWAGLAVGSLDVVVLNLAKCLNEWEAAGEPLFAIWTAPFEPFVRLFPLLTARGYHPVYFALDDYPLMKRMGYTWFNELAEEFLLRHARLILAVSEPLTATLHRRGYVAQYLPRGVELDDFRRDGNSAIVPDNLLRGDLTLGFWGSVIESMIDAAALELVARARPHWAINLIGPYDTDAFSQPLAPRLEKFSNIRLLGPVPHARLKDYAAQFDVCLIPSPDTAFTHTREPMKLYEYLACGKPVVTLHMAQLVNVPGVENVASAEDLIAAIERAAGRGINRAALDAYLAQQSWEVRVNAFLKLIAQPESDSYDDESDSSARVLSFVETNAEYENYLRVLEQNLAETQQWARELEAQVVAKEREWERIRRWLPVRLARSLRNFFKRSRKQSLAPITNRKVIEKMTDDG